MDFSKIRHGLKEITFIRSLKDAEIYFQKTAFLLPRIFGFQYRHTPVPASLQLEPTNCCNIRCICCPTARSSRKRGFMEFGLFQRIIDDASAIGVRRIHLYMHGEPMLHPKIVEMIRFIKSKGLFFNLVTNGMPFDDEKIKGILEAGVDLGDHIVFSVLGHSKNVHEKVMAGIDHDRVYGNISSLIELRRRRKRFTPIVEIVFYAMPENEREQIGLVNAWSGKVDHVRIISKISESFRGYKRSNLQEPAVKGRCPNIWERMGIFWNGDVTVCCEDVDGDYILGNLAQRTIREIWNHPELLALKRMHRRKEFHRHPLCSVCDM